MKTRLHKQLEKRVAGKTVLITGASSGIGLTTAHQLADAGAHVLLVARTQETLEQVKSEIEAKGGKASIFPCDLNNMEAIDEVSKQIIASVDHIDILINNAGLQHVAHIDEFPTEKFELLIKVMLTAPFMAIKAVLPHMRDQQWGRIINMASINGLIGFSGKAAYNSAKHGVIGLTKVAALETADQGITVNSVCPGYVDTPLVRNQLADLASTRGVELDKVVEEVIYPLVPQKRLLDVKEIADYTLFLCSDAAKGVTGQSVVLDGGYTVQ